MSANKTCTWYIDPDGNGNINETVAGMLRGLPNTIEENEECDDQKCEDGKSRSLYRCPDYAFVSRVIRHAQSCRLSFKIFCKEGKGGAIRHRASVIRGKYTETTRITAAAA